jgi:3-hydroxyisobutyrate dehydrogenase-like beta-hydroxyacid dehydrogenase
LRSADPLWRRLVHPGALSRGAVTGGVVMGSTVTMLGLGRMGSALASSFIDAGHDVTVWNRSVAPRLAFADRCRVADTAAQACAASELVVVCVADYAATRSILDDPACRDALRGRTLVHLSSGSPQDARTLAAFVDQHAIRYLDGAILTYPPRIGRDETLLVYAGDRDAFAAHRGTLTALSGRCEFVSDAVGAAAAVDQGWLSFLWASAAGLLQAVAFVESEGVDASVLFGAVPSFLVEIDAEARYYQSLIARGDFHGDLATLDVHVAGMQYLVSTARANAINDALPTVLLSLFSRAARDHGDEEIASAIRVFREPDSA